MGTTFCSRAASAGFSGPEAGWVATSLGGVSCVSVLAGADASGFMVVTMGAGCTVGAEFGAGNSCTICLTMGSGTSAGAVWCGR
ncbi:hypothetical protein SCD_n02201 [Sulfuricella denitrificans skB26]|uniref:Uncharacterized protein n=1 Tax=Sulfuricella denitrificans (strain DSM 22764 / NBRC 105220 / skB26) TaxID=1163617 RepID=S6AAK3_SULDS|nr:hypothetical protein SCD_n02201 [Sulfuricella denitrificans skB26]